MPSLGVILAFYLGPPRQLGSFCVGLISNDCFFPHRIVSSQSLSQRAERYIGGNPSDSTMQPGLSRKKGESTKKKIAIAAGL